MPSEVYFRKEPATASGGPATSNPRSTIFGDDTVERLTSLWEDLLGVPHIEPNQNYFDLGGDSALAVQLFAKIASTFHIQLPLATLFDAPTVAELADVLRREQPAAAWSPMVAIQPLGVRPPFFSFHGAGGNVLIYRELSQHLGNDQPFYGLQSQGLDGGSSPLQTIEDMARLYVKEIRKICPHGPYLLGGYCMGGTVAFEVAQQFIAQGEEVALLALFDTMNWSKLAPSSLLDKCERGLQRLQFHAANFLALDAGGMRKFFREKRDDLRERLPIWVGMTLSRFNSKRLDMPMPESMALARLWQMNDRACLAYSPKPYAGIITDFRPKRQYRQFSTPEAKWESLAQRGQEIVKLPVYPAGMLMEPFVTHLAQALRKAIDAAIAKYQEK